MATQVVPGQRTWSMTRDGEGHREYKITFLVEGAATDGPANALLTPGLPTPGSVWAYDGDVDLWAWCRWDAAVTPVLENEPNKHWLVEFTFSTKPVETRSCKEVQVEDPLLEPQKVSGSFVRFTEEATRDRFGYPILNSAHEQLRGPQVEFDRNRPQVRIEQNVPSLGYALFAAMIDTVNAAPIWGLPRRTVKLSNVGWERKFYGQCYPYYTRALEFDVRYDGFDRDLLDEGTKVLNGHWNPDTGAWVLDNIDGATPNPYDPTHFVRFKDRQGENCRAVLNGRGLPAGVVVALGSQFLSIIGGNVGQPLTKATRWLPLADGTTQAAWDFATYYVRGQLVTHGGSLYVARVDNVLSEPTTNDDWHLLGTTPFALTDKGYYDAGTTYTVGDYVTATAGSGGAGFRHVEKYPESNFLLLGVPLIF